MHASSPLIDTLAARLRTQRQLLSAQLRGRLHRGEDGQEMTLANYFAHQDDAAESNQLNDIDIAELDHDLRELKAVDLALQRIVSGSYGRCDCCGEDIAEERLLAQPSARLCLPCQKASEQRLPGVRTAPPA
jgi:DnaK suppressor protein